MTTAKSFLPLSAVVAFLLGTLAAPTLAFRTAPAGLAARHARQLNLSVSTVASSTALRMSDEQGYEEGYEYPKPNSQEQEMMDRALLELI